MDGATKKGTKDRAKKRESASGRWVQATGALVATVAAVGGVWLGLNLESAGEWMSGRGAVASEPKAMPPPRRGPLKETVYDRDLVVRRVNGAQVLHNHAAFYHNTSRRVLRGLSLGFVTPWAPRGDDVAWRFAARKLTHISPVLFDVVGEGFLRSKVDDAAARAWLGWLRSSTAPAAAEASGGVSPPARVPLVSLEALDLLAFFTGDGAEARSGRLLLALQERAIAWRLDGYVLHAHAHLASLPAEARRAVQPALHVFVQLLAAQLSQEGLQLLLLVPPHKALFSPTELAQLHEALAGVVVAAANYSAVRREPGPSAPLAWTRAALAALEPTEKSARKLMATLPMVGWDFALPDGPGAAIGSAEYLRLLREHLPQLTWHADAAEHEFRYTAADGKAHSVWYPSLRGVSERLGTFHSGKMAVGVALWELGTTLDYFWDLL